MKILVDAMGGDNAPYEIVKGCVDAVNAAEGFELEIIGNSSKINSIMSSMKFNLSRIHVTHAAEVVTNNDAPVSAVKQKKDSSLVRGLKMLKDKNGDVFISAGSTGALMTGSLLYLGRIKGVNRPALAPMVPSMCSGTMICDAGMNTMCKPINYLQFGIMGSEYLKIVHNRPNPKVGLVNVGTEDEKGNKLIKQAFELLSHSGLNFVGNIEGKDIAAGKVDLAVCDGFTGNVMLKMMEGTAQYIFSSIKSIYNSNLMTKLSALMVKNKFMGFKKSIDPEELGGTPILGVNGMVYKCHGSSKSRSIRNTILKAVNFNMTKLLDNMQYYLNMEVEEVGG